jgi:hypothetical protein
MYGSVSRVGMQKVLDAMAAECSLCSHSILADIGAGLGRCQKQLLVVHALLLHSCASRLTKRSALVTLAVLSRPLMHALIAPGIASGFGVECDGVKCQKAAAFLHRVKAELCRRGIADQSLDVPFVQNVPVEKARPQPMTTPYSTSPTVCLGRATCRRHITR